MKNSYIRDKKRESCNYLPDSFQHISMEKICLMLLPVTRYLSPPVKRK
jgi:hypothetical protein